MKSRERRHRKLLIAWVAASALAGVLVRAGQVVTDGSMGAHTALTGPNYNITASLGRQVGSNLLHSFTSLDLSAGEIATFSGPNSVANVLTRVTGGSPTSIDGTLRCTIPNANLFLINPSGVIFGPNAQLDVSGSFAVSTADYLKFADGNHFGVTNPSDTVLTSAAPTAFGFLGSNATGIGVSGSSLAVSAGKTISLVGGQIQIVGGTIQAPGGRVNIASAAGAGELTIDVDSLLKSIDVTPGMSMGDVSVTNSFVATTGDGGGQVSVKAGTLALNTSEIVAVNTGATDGLGVDISLTGNASFSPAIIVTDTFGAGRAGPINIAASAVTVDGSTLPGVSTGISAAASATGRGGDISFQVDSLSVLGGSSITAGTTGPRPGGAIAVTATGDVRVNGQDAPATAIGSATSGSGRAGDVTITAGSVEVINGGTVSSATTGAGAAGQVSVQVSNISIKNGATVTATSSGTGDAGTVAVTANRDFTLDGQASSLLTGIYADSVDGAGGRVQVIAGSISLVSGGAISASSYGAGSGGNVLVSANQTLSIDNKNTASLTGVFADTGDGTGGTVQLAAGDVSVLGGAQVSASSFGSGVGGTISLAGGRYLVQDPAGGNSSITAGAVGTGNAGGINLTVDTLTVGKGGSIVSQTGGPGAAGTINASARILTVNGAGGKASIDAITLGSGNAGTVVLNANTMSIQGGGLVSANTQATGRGGTVSVTASNLTLDGTAAHGNTGIYAESVVPPGGGTIGDAGTISVHADSLAILNGAAISTTTAGAAAGGGTTIVINGPLTIDGGASSLVTGVLANSLASGSAGGVTITANTIQVINQGAISSDASGSGPAGNVAISAGSMQVTSGGSISSNTNAIGAGSNVTVLVANDLTLDGLDHGGHTGISANSTSAGAGGAAGMAKVNAGYLLVQNGARIGSDTNGDGAGGTVEVVAGTVYVKLGGVISSGTFGAGAGGNVNVTGTNIVVDGANATQFTGITAQTNGSGSAGFVQIGADSLQVLNGGEISSATFASGNGKGVDVTAGNLFLRNDAFIDSASTDTGQAGLIHIVINGNATLIGSRISSEAIHSSGNDLTMLVGGQVTLVHSSITAQAAGEGGNIMLKSPNTIDLRSSKIITQAGGDGGNIIIDPSFVLLENSQISANGGNNGGNITIRPDFLLSSQSSITATGRAGVSGTLLITPDYNLSGALLALPASLADAAILQPNCAAQFSGDVSSFVVIGQGGAPPTPGNWLPATELRPPIGEMGQK